jgi:hypothetical protein
LRLANADTKSCTIEATIGDTKSYVELLTCLEMASFLRGSAQFQPTEPVQPRMKLGDLPDPKHTKASRRVDEMRREPDVL